MCLFRIDHVSHYLPEFFDIINHFTRPVKAREEFALSKAVFYIPPVFFLRDGNQNGRSPDLLTIDLSLECLTGQNLKVAALILLSYSFLRSDLTLLLIPALAIVVPYDPK
jgi:hypothetical protein